MRRKLITWRRLLAVPIILVLAIQLVPVSRSNPPVSGDVGAPEAVAAILRRACYDCHSNETEWPWYSYVAPVSWSVARDVEHGRETLNFSTWEAYKPEFRGAMRQFILEYVKTGRMPPESYVRFHEQARLSAEDIALLERWVGQGG